MMKRISIDYLAHRQTDLALRSHLGMNTERELLDYLGADYFYLPGRDIPIGNILTMYKTIREINSVRMV